MKKLLLPALGAAFAFAAPPPAAAQFMAPGQPGWTTSNRTLPPGSPGLSPSNVMTPSPFATAPVPSFPPASPFIGQRGDLNRAEPEFAPPGERDDSGRIGPTVDRQRARFTGERGPDGKLLPSYLPSQAQAPAPAQQSAPQSEDRMRSGQSPSTPQLQQQAPGQPREPTRRPGSGAADQQGQTGTSSQMAPPPMNQPQGSGTMQQGTTQQRRTTQPSADRQQQARPGSASQREMSETAALNALSAEGYSNIGRIERVGSDWQATAMKDGRQVTVSVDPQTSIVRER